MSEIVQYHTEKVGVLMPRNVHQQYFIIPSPGRMAAVNDVSPKGFQQDPVWNNLLLGL